MHLNLHPANALKSLFVKERVVKAKTITDFDDAFVARSSMVSTVPLLIVKRPVFAFCPILPFPRIFNSWERIGRNGSTTRRRCKTHSRRRLEA